MSCALYAGCDDCRRVIALEATDRGELGGALLRLRRGALARELAGLLRAHGVEAGALERFLAAHAGHRVRLCAMEEGGDVLEYEHEPA